MLTLEQVVEADALHRDLYRNFIWTSDQDVHGVEEFWDRMIPKNGKYRDDCDSFALEMDYRLKQSGFALEDRRLAACSISKIQIDHCALVLETPKGWMVSECNSPTLKKLNDLPYTMWYLAPRDGKITKDWEKL